MDNMNKPLTKNIRPDRAFATLFDYESMGGYQGLIKAIKELQPKEVQQCVKDAGLRGRGGAGFNTGLKWSLVPMDEEAAQTHYLVVMLMKWSRVRSRIECCWKKTRIS